MRIHLDQLGSSTGRAQSFAVRQSSRGAFEQVRAPRCARDTVKAASSALDESAELGAGPSGELSL